MNGISVYIEKERFERSAIKIPFFSFSRHIGATCASYVFFVCLLFNRFL